MTSSPESANGRMSVSRKLDLGGIGYSSESFEQLCATLCRCLQQVRPCTVSYVNPHVFNIAMQNRSVRELLARADIVAVDGLGFALGARLLTGQRQARTVMTPLFDRVLQEDDLPQLTALLIGGTDEVVALGAEAINRTSRRIRIIKTCHGYASMAEHLELLRRHPEIDLVLVAMGTPRSEELMLAAMDLFPGKFCWNIGGGTLHYYAGTKKGAPHWVSTVGLQWLWRMMWEPATVPRYLVGIPRFCMHLSRLLVLRQKPNPERNTYDHPHRQPCPPPSS
jgi:N-acetylglucosaminyldiphosphoundecaprenol N-acetyl-beta-D-mannosaminyltransferase